MSFIGSSSDLKRVEGYLSSTSATGVQQPAWCVDKCVSDILGLCVLQPEHGNCWKPWNAALTARPCASQTFL